MTARKFEAIKINLRSLGAPSVIDWLADTVKLWIRLMNGQRTCITTQAGDSVILNGNREFVDSIELDRILPASENGVVVRLAWLWLNPGAGIMMTIQYPLLPTSGLNGVQFDAIYCNELQSRICGNRLGFRCFCPRFATVV